MATVFVTVAIIIVAMTAIFFTTIGVVAWFVKSFFITYFLFFFLLVVFHVMKGAKCVYAKNRLNRELSMQKKKLEEQKTQLIQQKELLEVQIELKAGRRVGQLVFAEMDDTALKPYNGKYQGQKGATGSRVYMD